MSNLDPDYSEVDAFKIETKLKALGGDKFDQCAAEINNLIQSHVSEGSKKQFVVALLELLNK